MEGSRSSLTWLASPTSPRHLLQGMTDLLTGLAAVMAAVATLASFMLSPDVSTYQDKLANKRGVDAAEVLLDARSRQRWLRILFLAGPGAAPARGPDRARLPPAAWVPVLALANFVRSHREG